MKKKKIISILFEFVINKKTFSTRANHRAYRYNVTPPMRITRISFLLVIMLSLHIGLSAQSLTDKVSFGIKHQTLDNGLQTLGELSGFKMSYSADQVSQYKNISVEKKTRTVEATLNLLLANTTLTYEAAGKNILIVKKNKEQAANSSSILISGTVTDAGSELLPGVSIRVKGSNTGTITDVDGKYSIEVGKGDVLILSYLGYNPKEVQATASGVINVSLTPNSVLLSEVSVVSNGYQVVSKERSTGSFGHIGKEKLSIAKSPGVLDKIKGQVAGLLVDTRHGDGTFTYRNEHTEGSALNIRGINSLQSFYADSSPLVVIDGFPTSFDLTTLNPENIEDITFLKDASAASIWGARAANGVIVIRTKKGNKNTPVSINFSTVLSMSGKPDLKKFSTLNSSQTIDYVQEMIGLGRIQDQINVPQPLPLDQASELIFQNKRGEIDDATLNAKLNILRNRNGLNQVDKYLLNNPWMQQFNISLTGGNENSSYYVNGSYAKEAQSTKGNQSDRATITANNDFKFYDRFTLTTRINATWLKDKKNGIGLNALNSANKTLLPFDQIVDETGKRVQRYPAYFSGHVKNLESLGYLPWGYNELDELDNSDNTSNQDLIQVSTNLNTKIAKGLTLDLTYRYESNLYSTDNYSNQYTYAARDLVNHYTSLNADNELVYGLPKGGLFDNSIESSKQKSYRAQLNFDNTWKDHMFTAIAGTELRSVDGKGKTFRYYGYNDQTQTHSPIDYGITNASMPYNVDGYQEPVIDYTNTSANVERYLSYYSNAAYTYKNKYTASGSIRLDDYNYYGRNANNNPKPMYSTGLAWMIGKEEFLSKASFIDQLKLRLSYGFNGNIVRNVFPYTAMRMGNYDPYSNAVAGMIYSAANPNLKWEKTKQLNFGIDFALFNNILSGTVEYYDKHSSDLIKDVLVNPTNGFVSIQKNASSMQGHGVDVTLNLKALDLKNYGLTINANFAYNTHKVTDGDLIAPSYVFYSNIPNLYGYPIDNLFVYRFAGLDAQGQSQVLDKNGKILTINDDASTINERVYAGRTSPPYFGGAQFSARIYNFDISLMTSYKFGHKALRNALLGVQADSQYRGYLVADASLNDRWRKPGDEQNTNVPGMEYLTAASLTRYQESDINVLNASQIRLEQLSVSYTLPEKLINKKVIKGMSLSASVRNLGVIVFNKYGIDTDYQSSLISGVLPLAKTYVFSLNINL